MQRCALCSEILLLEVLISRCGEILLYALRLMQSAPVVGSGKIYSCTDSSPMFQHPVPLAAAWSYPIRLYIPAWLVEPTAHMPELARCKARALTGDGSCHRHIACAQLWLQMPSHGDNSCEMPMQLKQSHGRYPLGLKTTVVCAPMSD